MNWHAPMRAIARSIEGWQSLLGEYDGYLPIERRQVCASPAAATDQSRFVTLSGTINAT